MLGDADEVSENDAAVSEDWQISSRCPEWIVGVLLVDRSSGELGKCENFETLWISAWDTPVRRPGL